MKRIFSLLLAVILVLSGCGVSYEEDPGISWEEYQQSQSSDEETSTPEEEINYPAVFSMAYYKGHTLDPITCGDGAQLQLTTLLYEPLFRLDGNFQPQGVLCTECSASEDGLVYTLTIRQGVTFSDGSTLESSDAAISLRRAMASERYGSRLSGIRQVTTRGSDTLVITLSRPNSRLAALLDIPVIKAGSEEGGVPAGTGPYLFITSGEGAYLSANPDWWQGIPGGLL